jgi:hypothetical protein
MESWRSELVPQISWTNPREDYEWINTLACGDDIFLGVEVKTEGEKIQGRYVVYPFQGLEFEDVT